MRSLEEAEKLVKIFDGMNKQTYGKDVFIHALYYFMLGCMIKKLSPSSGDLKYFINTVTEGYMHIIDKVH